MGVRDDDHLRFQSMAFEDPHDFRNVVAWIDDDGLAADFIAQHRTVASQHSDGQDFVNHLIYFLLPTAHNGPFGLCAFIPNRAQRTVLPVRFYFQPRTTDRAACALLFLVPNR
jgi:hypothetical protein